MGYGWFLVGFGSVKVASHRSGYGWLLHWLRGDDNGTPSCSDNCRNRYSTPNFSKFLD
jgi:hypothetical protein